MHCNKFNFAVFFTEKMGKYEKYSPAEITTGDRLIDWEKRVNTVLKIRPGHFHDVDKKVCEIQPQNIVLLIFT